MTRFRFGRDRHSGNSAAVFVTGALLALSLSVKPDIVQAQQGPRRVAFQGGTRLCNFRYLTFVRINETQLQRIVDFGGSQVVDTVPFDAFEFIAQVSTLLLAGCRQIQNAAAEEPVRAGSETSVNASTPVGRSPIAARYGDFNRDGRDDLAVANQRDNNVSILIAKSDGGYNAAVNYPAGTSPNDLTVADFTGDGRLDVAVANAGRYVSGAPVERSISILRGNGDGTFSAAVNLDYARQPLFFDAADFNGDQRADLVVVGLDSNGTNLALLTSNGDGTFQNPVAIQGTSYPSHVRKGDFNGDGKADMAVSDSNSVLVYLGSGNGAFQAPRTFDTQAGAWEVETFDLNKDGKRDLVVTSLAMDTVSVLLGNGDGNFQAARHYAVGHNPESVAAGDINRDGNVDLVVVNNGSEFMSVLYGNGDGTFKAMPNYALSSPVSSIASADLNGDGKPDLAAVQASGSSGLSVLLNAGAGRFQNPVNVPLSGASGSVSASSVAAADINRDGKPDIVAAGSGRTVSVLLGKGDGTFQSPATITAGGGAPSVMVADLNSDGKPDVVVAHSGASGVAAGVAVLIGNGDGSFKTAVNYAAGLNPRTPISGDFNRDGTVDLIVADYGALGGSAGGIVQLAGNGDGTFKSATSFQVGTNPAAVAAADFNGDGSLDLAVGTSEGFNHNIAIALGNGNGSFQAARNIGTDFGPNQIAASDLNGDGTTDLAVTHCCGNTHLGILPGKGDGTFGEMTLETVGSDPSSLVAGDFNSDGKVDLAVAGGAQQGGITVLINGTSFPETTRSISLNGGGAATITTPGTGSGVQAGYAALTLNSGPTPYGTAVFSLRQNGAVVSEAAVPASPPTSLARIFIDLRNGVPAQPAVPSSGTVDISTGLALVNRGTGIASIRYTLRSTGAATLAEGQGTLAAGAHFAKFITELKDVAPGFALPSNFASAIQFGSLEIASDQPLSVVALRLTINQRGETLLTSTPVADLSKAPGSGALYFPQAADGGGYTTTVVLLNTSGVLETGTLTLFSGDGGPFPVNRVGGTRDSGFAYSIPPSGAFVLQTDGSPLSANAGWVQVAPTGGTPTPEGAAVFGFTQGGVMVTESGVPGSRATTRARIFVDQTGGHDTGLALASPGSGASISLRAYQLDGVTGTGGAPGPVTLGANGHTARFVGQLVSGLPDGFRGVLEISASTPFAALTLRSLTNGRGNFLLTTLPIADLNQPAPSPVVFPQIADGGGYVTEFILLSPGGESSATLGFFGDTGVPLAMVR